MGCNYYIIDSINGDIYINYIKDDSGASLFYFNIEYGNSNPFLKLYDKENREIITKISRIDEGDTKRFYIFDSKNRRISEVYKDYYYKNIVVKGIFGDFNVVCEDKHTKSYKIKKSGITVAEICNINKYNDLHLGLKILQEQFSLISIMIYILIDKKLII